jgi:hypothetical protein
MLGLEVYSFTWWKGDIESTNVDLPLPPHMLAGIRRSFHNATRRSHAERMDHLSEPR